MFLRIGNGIIQLGEIQAAYLTQDEQGTLFLHALLKGRTEPSVLGVFSSKETAQPVLDSLWQAMAAAEAKPVSKRTKTKTMTEL